MLDDEAFAFETSQSPPPRNKKLSSGSRGSRKKSTAKLVIGAPTDFKHESHMGFDEVSSPHSGYGAWPQRC